MDTIEEVKTILLIPAFFAALKALCVPSTAGLMYRFSSFGSLFIKGEATCKTYSQPFIASFQPSSFNKSNSQNSKFPFGSICLLISAKIFSVLERLLTDPFTAYPCFNNSNAQCAPIYPDIPVTNTFFMLFLLLKRFIAFILQVKLTKYFYTTSFSSLVHFFDNF